MRHDFCCENKTYGDAPGIPSEISDGIDVFPANVKYYILVRGTSEGDKSQSHISSHFAPIES